MHVGIVFTALGAALVWIGSQYMTGIGPNGVLHVSALHPLGFGVMFVGMVIAIADGMRRALRRAVA